MTIEEIFPSSINRRAIERAVDCLRDGRLIVYPTDTLYALGCDALNNRAIERLCAFKGINPAKQNLSVVCADISQASEYAKIDNRAFALLKQYLPGPFTFILPASARLPKVFKGRRTVGIRIPDNPIPRALAEALGNPILSASVAVDPDNDYDPASPQALAEAYRHVADLLIDGGEGHTTGSTIVDCLDSAAPVVIRQGLGDIDLD